MWKKRFSNTENMTCICQGGRQGEGGVWFVRWQTMGPHVKGIDTVGGIGVEILYS